MEKWRIGWNYIYEFTCECFPDTPVASETELKLITKAVLHEAARMVNEWVNAPRDGFSDTPDD